MVLVAHSHRNRRSEGDESQSEGSVHEASFAVPYLSSSNALMTSADRRWSNDARSPFTRGESAVVNPNFWPSDSMNCFICGSSSLFHFMAMVLKQNGRPLCCNRSIPRI